MKTSPQMPQQVEIFIDRVVLEGFDPLHARSIGEAIKEHLALLVSREGLPDTFAGSAHFHEIQGGPFRAAREANPQQAGAGIAQSIYQGFRNASSEQQ